MTAYAVILTKGADITIGIKTIGLVSAARSPLMIVITFPELVSVMDLIENRSILLYIDPVMDFRMLIDI